MTESNDRDIGGVPFDDPKALKAWFIEAAFESEFAGGLEERIEVLGELWAKERTKREARILVVCYIDGFGRLLYADKNSTHRSFVKVLVDYGDDELFSLTSPRRLGEQIQKKGGHKWARLSSDIKPVLSSFQGELIREAQLAQALRKATSTAQFKEVEGELWRGTMASATYEHFRNAAVHHLGARPLCLVGQTYDGQEDPEIDFPRLHLALKSIAKAAKQRLLEDAQEP